MPTLTPKHREKEVTMSALQEGIISGTIAFIPSFATVWYLMRNSKSFVTYTNWQSRTACVAVPTLFFFALSSEQKMIHKMHEVAAETEHAHASTEWAEMKHAQDRKQLQATLDANKKSTAAFSSTTPTIEDDGETEARLAELYRQSILDSGIRVVPGDRLGLHHRIANFGAENPLKVLALFGVPAVAYIFYGRSSKDHLQLQMKVMHTRVMGQFSVIVMLLSLMGFKYYMDSAGKYVTEAEANARVSEMQRMRQDLLARLEANRRAKEAMEATLKAAHEQDVLEGNTAKTRKAKRRAIANLEGPSV